MQVWVDALLEAGDPRGTFASLQLLGEHRPLTSKEQKEVAGLLKANRSVWLGSLGAAVEPANTRFRRGLLSVATAKPKRIKGAVLEDPAWRTVEQLHSTVAHLQHPNLVSLRRIGTAYVPDPTDTKSLVGFAIDGKGGNPTWEEMQALMAKPPRGITHLETQIVLDDPGHARIPEAFPDLETVALWAYYAEGFQIRDGLAGWLARIPTVILM
ncbi:MAG: hypothetical protein KC656_36725, partial [Myxococcales bacterium]|nr:hypothetical protein [Myxococcales bacterium]